MEDYHWDLLLNMKNINNKYIELTSLPEIYTNNKKDNNSFNDNFLEKQLFEKDFEKDINSLYNKINLFKKKHKNPSFIPLSLVFFFNKVINDSIIDFCTHDFVEDDIDISPDKSQKINYCSICENNLDDCIKN